MSDAAKTKKLSKKAAAVEIAAILRRVGGGVNLEQLCIEVASDVEQERTRVRQIAQLRRTYRIAAEPGETWEAFVKDAIEIGEWDPDWGMPTETD